MMNHQGAGLRWLGVFFLAIALGMLVGGQTVLSSRLEGWVFLLYWFICLGFTLVAIFIALLDVRAIRRRTQDEQRELITQTLEEIESKRKCRDGSTEEGEKTKGGR